MQLSQELFAEITGVHLNAPPPPGGPAASADRRQHRRVSFDQRARIFPLMEGVGESGSAVLIRDISVMGIGFLAADPIGVGDEFVIRLPTQLDQPVDIQCAVRRCELSGTCGSQFAVGATFELVLNRSLSSAIAPESEILPEEAATNAPQSAEPSIEQRYDQQRETSLLIRPVIQQTRMDRWLANPRVQKIHRVLNRIFWPVMIVYRAINRLMTATEEARIRSRLSSSKRGKWKKAQKRSRPSPAQLLAKLPALPESAAPQAPSSNPVAAEVYTSLFEMAAANAEQTKESPASAPSNSKRSSLFATGEPVENAPPNVPTPAIAHPIAEALSVSAPLMNETAVVEMPSQSKTPVPDMPAPDALAIQSLEQTVPVAPPEAAPTQALTDPVVVREPLESASAKHDASNTKVPFAESVVTPSEPKVVASASEQQIDSQPNSQPQPEPALSFNEPIRTAPVPLKGRPPSPLARHSRRRHRSAFYR